MNRRAFLGAGATVIAAASGVRYVPLATGSRFEALFADALGIRLETANALLDGARRDLGDRVYDRRAAQFAIALQPPLAALIPAGVRRRAIDSLLAATLRGPTRALAFALDRPPVDACGGLIRQS